MKKKPRCVFGPVPSRRLGRSLGVDLVPFKTCTFNCLYCQLGPTPVSTVERREFVPPAEIVESVRHGLEAEPDYVTISGSGEPTLYKPLGELLRRLKELSDTPLAVLTNGSLLWRAEVREALLVADLAAPSLDAGDEETFRRVNRPHEECTFDRLMDGLRSFRDVYPGRFWLEVFLLAGINDDEESAARLAAAAARINPDRVQLNTVARPPAEKTARAVSEERMRKLLPLFGDNAEIIADFAPKESSGETKRREAVEEEIVALLRRRPCTSAGLARGLGVHHLEVVKHLEHLLRRNRIGTRTEGGETFYVVRP